MSIKLADTTNLLEKMASMLFSYNGPALSQLWLVEIDATNLTNIISYINSQRTDYDDEFSLSDLDPGSISREWYINNTHCLLAMSQTILPSDSINTQRSLITNSGLVGGLFGSTRDAFPNATISFLETNNSFIDFVLRPWMTMVGHKSLKDFNLRMNITMTEYQKVGQPSSGFNLIPRKRVKLIDAAPVRVSSEELNYTGDKIMIKNVEFAYTKYKIEPLIRRSVGSTTPQGSISRTAKSSHINIPLPNIDYNLFTGDKTWLETIQDMINNVENGIDTAQSVIGKVHAKISNIQTQAVTLAQKLGLNEEANSIQQAMDRLKTNTTQKLSSSLYGIETKVSAGTNAVNIAGEATHLSGYPNTTQVKQIK
jgi:hypothetical protein